MSDFVDEEQAYDDDQMQEVEVDDSAPVDEEESDAGNYEQFDTIIDTMPAVDLSFVSFNGHTDSVYCAAVHPNQPGVVITGTNNSCNMLKPL